MKIVLFKLLLQLKKLINILLDKLDDRKCIINKEESYQLKNDVDSDCIDNSIYEVLNENTYENHYNNILRYTNVNEECEQIKNDGCIEEIINKTIDLEIDTDTESNDINEFIYEEKYDENYNRIDIKAICEDRTITPIEKIYLIQLIANINVADNCVKMSLDELVNLFSNKNRNQVTKKMQDLERAGVIKIIHTNKGNIYYVLKYIKEIKYECRENNESIRNDTSITSDTFKFKEIEGERVNNEIVDLILNNISYFKKGLDWNENYLSEVVLKSNKVDGV